jgi:hypothetical protein
MELIECAPESIDRMYCPSTDEVIFAPGMEEIADNAEALLGYWHHGFINEPHINNEILKAAWDEYFSKNLKDEFPFGYKWEELRKFFLEYENQEWLTYECDFYGMACGPVTTTVIYVVKADTIIEVDPDYDEEEAEEKSRNMTEDEMTDEVLGRQIRALLGNIDKEKK